MQTCAHRAFNLEIDSQNLVVEHENGSGNRFSVLNRQNMDGWAHTGVRYRLFKKMVFYLKKI